MKDLNIDLKFAPLVALLSGFLSAVVMVVAAHGWQFAWLLVGGFVAVGAILLAMATRRDWYPALIVGVSLIGVAVVSAGLHIWSDQIR